MVPARGACVRAAGQGVAADDARPGERGDEVTGRTPGALQRLSIDGGDVELRYMEPADADTVLAFARSVPKHDLMFLSTDITTVEGVNGWVDDVLLGLASVILATREDEIVGFGGVARHEAIWMRHIADLHVVVGAAWRGHGLGHRLASEGLSLAGGLGVRRVMTQMTLDQIAAMRTFRALAFVPVAVLHDQVSDTNGETYDLLLMHRDIASGEEI